jgi:hypothetical protein
MDAFQFFTKLDQTLLLGLGAKTVEELLNGIRTVQDSSIYFHTHRFLQQHHFLSPEPPKDFTYGINGREHVRNNFLITCHRKGYLLLFVSLMHEGDVVCL